MLLSARDHLSEAAAILVKYLNPDEPLPVDIQRWLPQITDIIDDAGNRLSSMLKILADADRAAVERPLSTTAICCRCHKPCTEWHEISEYELACQTCYDEECGNDPEAPFCPHCGNLGLHESEALPSAVCAGIIPPLTDFVLPDSGQNSTSTTTHTHPSGPSCTEIIR